MKETLVYTDAIRAHSHRLGRIAPGHFDVLVPACPGWRVREVLLHLSEVHRFWGTVVANSLLERPELNSLVVDDGELVSTFLRGAEWMCDVLATANQSTAVYTWAPSQSNVAFVTRHQFQEIAIHLDDVARVVGAEVELEPELCADAVDEFLRVSVSSPDDPADPPRPALDGPLVLRSSDTDDAWTLRDAAPGQVTCVRGALDDAPVISAPARDLLRWLYGRQDISVTSPADEIAQRLRALTFMD